MARLGKADTQAHSGQLDAAIATWKEMTTGNTDDLPVDAILMELARAYVQKGNTEEARKTFTQIVDQHPNSPYLGRGTHRARKPQRVNSRGRLKAASTRRPRAV